MLPLTRSRNRARFFGIPFSPSSLFAAGEQGAWYDPSDLSTMFNDAAGTQPITSFTTNQPVGLLLDKSKGLVLGSELAANILGSTSGWTFVGAANVTGGALVFNTPPSTNASAQYNPIVASGKWYRSTVTLTGAGQVNVQLGSAGTTVTLVAPGTYTIYGIASGGTPTVLTFSSVLSSVNNFVGSVTAISVRELSGNHATASGMARPVLSKRYNLLTRTEEFDNGAWVKASVTVTANATDAPNNTTTADKVVATNTASTTRGIYQNFTPVSGVQYAIAFYAKAAEYSKFCVNEIGGGRFGATFDLVAETSASLGGAGFVSSNITATGNGWYRCVIVATGGASGWAVTAVGYPVGATLSAAGCSYAGDGTSGIFIWGADLRRTIDANAFQPAYQRVVTATDYDGDGFLPYLEYSGAQAMATGTVDFSATDKVTVFAGVTKLSDATDAALVELSATVNTNNGSFGIFAPSRISGAYNKYAGSLRGTAQSISELSAYAAPITNVLSAQYDIAGATIAAESIYRVNGLAPTEVTNGTLAGTGNFGNYPLYIGARNAASIFFTGRQYSLIVRGAQSSAAQISATEAWINQRTGAF